MSPKLLFTAAVIVSAGLLAPRDMRATVSSTNTPATAAPVLRHVVLFAFKPSATPADIQRVATEFAALAGKISVVKGIEWGTNNSPENLANGFTHAFIVTFADAAGRDAYLPHPAHTAFTTMAGPFIEKALVVDFVVR
jgi:Stress responsive A/B Barrel Domain